jgi:molybdopterin converting factor small subunit
MTITVHYTAQLRHAAGLASEPIEVPAAATVADLLTLLVQRHGPVLGGLLLAANGRPEETVLVFVGDEQVGPGSATLLREGDTVTLLSPIAGGSLPDGTASAAD